MVAPGALYREIEPYLQCGTVRLFILLEPARGTSPPSVTIGIEGGVKALEAATDDEIILAMQNATAIGKHLRSLLPPRWVVLQ